MCGIAGFKSPLLDRDVLQRMTDVITHRGPDAEGHFVDPDHHIGLGHRRLSILDLSTSANQPFYSHDQRFVMVYNGEVYNFQEIRSKYGIETKTTSDTEVIIEGYALVGNEIFKELNGMFALAIWDTLSNELIMARDRVGIKPLYIALDDKGLLFGSEIKSILCSKKFPVNRSVLSHFLHFGYFPQQESLFEGIEKFPAGHFGVYKDGKLKSTPFWIPDDQIQAEKNKFSGLDQAKERLSDLIESSVKLRMISDVPLGTFLSGGIDSSIVTAFAQKVSSKPVKTFSIGFKEAKFNELKYASAVAKHLGTDHHEYILSENQAVELVDRVLDIYDEPFADSSSIPTYMVSEVTRKKVTVALSGDGGDELFMGYGTHKWAQRLNHPVATAFRKPIAWMLSKGNNRSKRVAHLFKWKKARRIKSHIFSQEQYYFSDDELKTLLNSEFYSNISIDENDPVNANLSAREAQAFFDLKNYLKDDLLVKVDRASMYHSLEVRVPLLDHRIVEFCLNLPENLKVKGSNTKYLLKEVLYDHVPSHIFNRPKWGFGMPLHIWLKKDLKFLIDTHLSHESVENAQLVNWEYVEHLKSRFFAGEDYLNNRIWVLLILHKWINKVSEH